MRIACAILLAAGVLGLVAPGARADADPGESFQQFCSQWMQKLHERRLFSLRQAQAAAADRDPDDSVVLKYNAYSELPVRCEAKAGKNGGFIGRLVYHELQMQKAGKTPKRALENRPSVLSRTEVMEIFRFDGKRWKY